MSDDDKPMMDAPTHISMTIIQWEAMKAALSHAKVMGKGIMEKARKWDEVCTTTPISNALHDEPLDRQIFMANNYNILLAKQNEKLLDELSDLYRSGHIDKIRYDAALAEAGKPEVIPNAISEMVEQRWAAQKADDYVESDKLRELIAKEGYTMRDTKVGFEVMKTATGKLEAGKGEK